jgi:hypothetical protein
MYKVRIKFWLNPQLTCTDIDELEEEAVNAASQSTKSVEANRALYTIDESHLQSTSMDDVFDPLNSFDLGNDLGDGMAPFDLGLDWDPQPE